MTFAASPIRYPDVGTPELMTRRGWWLVALNLVIPGSAQVLAGNRRLGRFGLGMTLLMWAIAIAGIMVYLFWRPIIPTVATSSIALWIAQILLVVYAVLWLVLTFDTLRLVRLVKAPGSARAGIAAFSVLLLVAVSGTAGYGAFLAGSMRGALTTIFSAGPPVPPVDGRYNIMLLGGDAGPDRLGLRPDSISVVSIDAQTGKAVTIGLPRDLADVPFVTGSPMHAKYPNGYGYDGRCAVDACMLNSIYTEVELRSPKMYPDAASKHSNPGIEGMRDAVEGILGIKIQFFVLIDMEGFADLVNALGGVEITVARKLPIGGNDQLQGVTGWIYPGKQHMNGYTAEWFARSRHGSPGGDYDRMARQRELQQAILKQMSPANVVTKFDAIAKAGTQVVKTDIPQQMLGYFVNLGAKTRKLPVSTLEMVPPKVDPLHPDYATIRAMTKAALAPVTPSPTP